MIRSLPGMLAALAAVIALGLGAALVLTFGRPPQPLAFGTVQWVGEAGVTVDGVDRVSMVTAAGHTVRARGQYYIVHARILAPFGLRPTWHDRDAYVLTFSGSGGTMRGLRFAIDPAAQAVLDARTGRPGPDHLVRGASQREDIVFDLPRDVEQPGLIVAPANAPEGIVNWLFGGLWQPHRFNLRYD